MNLTYFDTDFDVVPELGATRAQSGFAVMAANARAKKMVVSGAIKPAQLGGFFSSLVNFVKTTNSAPIKASVALVTHGPAATKAQMNADLTAGEKSATGVIGVLSPILSALSPFTFGITGLVAVALGAASADYKAKMAKAATVQAQANAGGLDLLNAYTAAQNAGTMPGRLIGLPTMRAVVNAALMGSPPVIADPLGQWANMVADFFDAANGRSASNPNHTAGVGLVQTAQQLMQQGATGPAQIMTQFVKNQSWNTASPTAQQIVLDATDAVMASIDPSTPFTYGITPDAATQTAAATISQAAGTTPLTNSQVVSAQVAPLTQATTQPVSSSVPVAAIASVAPDPTTANAISAMLAQMQAQGATLAQMQAAANTQLTNAGVNTSAPQVQAAVQQAVAPSSDNSSLIYIALGLGAILLLTHK